MIDIFIITSSITIFTLLGFIPFHTLFKNKENKFIENFLFNIIIAITLILFFNIIGFKVQAIIYLFYIFLLSSTIYLILIFKRGTFDLEDTKFLIFIVLLYFIISSNLVYNLTLTWEAQTIWLDKTILLKFDQGIFALKNTPLPEFPFLFPVLWSFFWKFLNFDTEYVGRLFLVFFYLVSLFTFVNLFKTNFRIRIIIFLISVLITFRIQGFQGDLAALIFSLILINISSYYLLLENKKKNFTNILIFLLTLNLLLYTSNEGMFFAFIILITLVLNKNLKKTIKLNIAVPFLILFTFKISVFIYYEFGLSLNSDNYALTNISKNLNIGNLILILKYLIFNILRTELLMLAILFMILEYSLIKKFNYTNFYFIILNILFIFSFFLFNAETLEGILKQKMIDLLYYSSALYIIPIINSFNSISKRG